MECDGHCGRYHTPSSTPLDFASTQNNRANLLGDIATLPGEDRRARLLQALAAYDEALRFRTPSSAPLDFAQTQNNRANLLGDIATLPGENRLRRLAEALRAASTARVYFDTHNHQTHKEISTRTFEQLRLACSLDIDRVWQLMLAELPPIKIGAMLAAANKEEAAIATASNALPEGR